MNKEALLLFAAEQDLEWNEPATTEEIAELEEQLGVELPQDYKEFLEWHNGTDDREFCSTEEAADNADEFLEIAEEMDEVETFLEEDYQAGRVGKGTFVKGWVPFYDDGTGAVDVVDCAPGPNGTHGQVIHYDPDGDMSITHTSFTDWVESRDEDEEIEFD